MTTTPLLGDGPIFEQIAEGIRHEILTGQLCAGDQVLSVAGYAAAHRINPATAQRAFAVLVDEGLLEKRRGIGMFITPEAAELLGTKRRADYAQTQLVPAIQAGIVLGFTPTEITEIVHRHLNKSEES